MSSKWVSGPESKPRSVWLLSPYCFRCVICPWWGFSVTFTNNAPCPALQLDTPEKIQPVPGRKPGLTGVHSRGCPPLEWSLKLTGDAIEKEYWIKQKTWNNRFLERWQCVSMRKYEEQIHSSLSNRNGWECCWCLVKQSTWLGFYLKNSWALPHFVVWDGTLSIMGKCCLDFLFITSGSLQTSQDISAKDKSPSAKGRPGVTS